MTIKMDPKKPAAQGDVFFLPVKKLPPGVVEVPRHGPIVVAHSETGHNHEIADPSVRQFEVPGDPFTCYLQLGESGQTDVVHHRSFDTHDTIRLIGSVVKVKRQREGGLESWRRVDD